MEQVLALEVELRAAQAFREPPGVEERRGTAREISQQAVEFGLEIRITTRSFVRLLQFLDRVHQGFRHKTAAEFAEAPTRVRPLAPDNLCSHIFQTPPLAREPLGFHRSLTAS